jgi:DNA invertase Pin-like site-specific DNA recombinase
MANAFGYFRCRPFASDQIGKAPLEALQVYCQGQGFQLVEVFTDGHDSADTPWLDRPAGSQLANGLASGDTVVADGRSIWTTADDLLSAVRDWNARGIILNALVSSDAVLSTADSGGEAMERALQAFAELRRNFRSEATTLGMQEKKQRGEKYCRHAGYGYRWRNGRRVPNESEQAVISWIVEWREDGQSWYAIAARLLREGVKTASGNEWSPSRVRRAYLTEISCRSPSEEEGVQGCGKSEMGTDKMIGAHQ